MAPHIDKEVGHPAYHRVLLKLSGEVFGGGDVGVDPVVVKGIAMQIADAVHDDLAETWAPFAARFADVVQAHAPQVA